MTDIFTHTIKTITDSTQRWTTRSAAVILILFGLWFLNDTFNFVQSYRVNNKLQELEQIGQLLKDTTLTKYQTDILLKERDKIFDHKTTLDNLLPFLYSLPNPISIFRVRSTGNQETPGNPLVKSYWLNFVSSNAFLLVIIVLLPFNVSIKNAKLWVIIIAYIFVIGALLITCALIAYLFDFIPVIGSPWVNYALNFSIQLFFWMIFGFLLGKVRSKKT